MATYTTNYNLTKIDLNDAPPDITVLNQNWDTIDEKLKEHDELTAEQVGALPLTGGTLSGQLIVQADAGMQIRRTINGVEYYNQHFNSGITIGNAPTTGITMHDVTNKVAKGGFFFNGNGVQLQDMNGKMKNIFGEHNTDVLATHIQNIIQGGSVSMVRKIQRGTVTLTQGASSTEVTLSGFTNLSKMSVNLYGSAPLYGGDSCVLPYVTSLTTSKLTVAPSTVASNTRAATLSYEVVEYY